jgi:hypothetical protein
MSSIPVLSILQLKLPSWMGLIGQGILRGSMDGLAHVPNAVKSPSPRQVTAWPRQIDRAQVSSRELTARACG